MVFSNKKSFSFIFAVIIFSVSGFCSAQDSSSQSSNVQSASRKTAVRYLKLAEQYSADKKWSAADSNAEIGLAYDDSIADLWYIRAVSKVNSGVKKGQVFPYIVKALTEGQWVDYNKESARVLYADLLCSTREFDQALAVLDGAPFVYSADAEYIRIKSYYNLNTAESLEKARDKVDAARRIYPDDQRFADLFFRSEYVLGGRNEDNSKIADTFIKLVSFYKKPSVDIEIYACLFAEGEQKTRMLKSFNARGLKSPLYAVAALEENLMSEDKALDYFYSFSDKSIDFSVLKKFASTLKDSECKREFGEYLNQYNGIIYRDTDGDLTYNMTVDYKRGRPQKITFDETQDEQEEWSAECDFGVPYSIHLTEGDLTLEYDSWPSVSKAEYGKKAAFNLVSEVLFWTPFKIIPDKEIKESLNVDFYVPEINEEASSVSGEQLIAACSSYEVPSNERKDGSIKVSMLDGKAQMARYYSGDKMYGQTQFDHGLPAFRTVDMDGDGLFETTETYGYTPEGQNVISKEDEYQVLENLFGEGDSSTGLYVKMIQIDQNGDTIPDFTEEYTEGQGKITSWDLDNDGQWETRYVKQPVETDGTLVEVAMFRQPLSKSVVTVTTKNGQPYKVGENDTELNVVKSADYDLWWIGEAGSKKDAEKILKTVNQNTVQGVCNIVISEPRRMLAVRIGQYIFGEILPDEQVILEKVENE